MKIVANCMVKNEEHWLWYAVNSVMSEIDELLIWDTGSTDRTIEVIKSISSPKIKFQRFNITTPAEHSQIRQKMLNETRADWLFILDGDEIWPTAALHSSLAALSADHDFLINTYFNLLGDVYHYQEAAAGRYHIGPYTGHLTTRFLNLNSLTGLHYSQNYPLESFCTKEGIPIQSLVPLRTKLINSPYLHATHLRPNSSTTLNRYKYKHELGLALPGDFAYPRSFYFPHPPIVASPWRPRPLTYSLQAVWQSPLRFLKRRLIDHT